MRFEPTPSERSSRDQVLANVCSAIRAGVTILLPRPSRLNEEPSETALQRVGIEPNDFGATVGDYRYQFEGEEDLLHLIVVRTDARPLAPEAGQAIAGWVLDGVPPGMVWIKPGHVTQHFYVGHEDLLRACS